LPINPVNFILVVLVNFGFQFLAFKYLRILNIAPDVTLLLIIYLSLSITSLTGLLAASGLGLCQELLLRSAPGGCSAGYLVVAYLAGRLVAMRFKPSLFCYFLFSLYFSFLFSVTYQTILAPAWGAVLFWKPAIFSLYNGLLSLPAFYLYQQGLK